MYITFFCILMLLFAAAYIYIKRETKKHESLLFACVAKGTGHRLPALSGLISMMDNQGDSESEYGKASDLSFTKLQRAEDEEKKAPQTENLDFTAPKAYILVVDDTSLNLMIAEEMLEPVGIKIDTAATGRQAVSMVENNLYDMIFMDYMMPDLDGVEATEQIRKLDSEDAAMAEYFRSVPIVALTGDADEETKQIFFRAGIDDFAEKPVSADSLKRLLLKWLPNNLIERPE